MIWASVSSWSRQDYENKNPDTETNEGNAGKTIGTKPGDNLNPVLPKDITPTELEPSESVFHPGKMPEPLNLSRIQSGITYPVNLREQDIEGKVIFRVLVGADGKYIRHIVKKSTHKRFT